MCLCVYASMCLCVHVSMHHCVHASNVYVSMCLCVCVYLGHRLLVSLDDSPNACAAKRRRTGSLRRSHPLSLVLEKTPVLQLYMCLWVYVCMHLVSMCLSVYLSIRLCVYVSMCLCIYVSMRPCVYASLCPCI